MKKNVFRNDKEAEGKATKKCVMCKEDQTSKKNRFKGDKWGITPKRRYHLSVIPFLKYMENELYPKTGIYKKIYPFFGPR